MWELDVTWDVVVITLCIIVWYIRNIKLNETLPYLVELPDPLFAMLPPPVDTSLPVALILWGCTADFLWHWEDWSNMQFCWTYSLFMVLRSIIIFLHPFRGCSQMIPLRDPIIELISRPKEVFLHDNALSGHCSLLFLFGLMVPAHRWVFWACTAITSILMALSRVHYVADCILGPVSMSVMFVLSNVVREFWATHGNWWATAMICAAFLWHRHASIPTPISVNTENI